MVLKYPSIGDKPLLFVHVEDMATGNRTLFPMLLDTGADETCFPASYAAYFGHNNLAPEVSKKSIHGVGGESQAYIHSVRLVLIDPEKSTKKAFVPVWSSTLCKATFVSSLDMTMGLLGRDVMVEWQDLSFAPVPHRASSKWDITIRI
ncbi:MAG: hypothetical protein WCS01_07140 [bacterium]